MKPKLTSLGFAAALFSHALCGDDFDPVQVQITEPGRSASLNAVASF